jgi:hypothetical protein
MIDDPIPVHLAVEDELSDAVVRKILESSGKSYAVGVTFSRGGYGYLKNKISGFNNAARGTPFFVLTDLDQTECAPSLIEEWLPGVRNPNLIFRVAVREVEAWLLADRHGFSEFLGIAASRVPPVIEDLDDPKQTLINLTRRSRKRDIRTDIVPPDNSRRLHGPNYNGRLIEFVNTNWNIREASRVSYSLRSAVNRIAEFNPTWRSS